MEISSEIFSERFPDFLTQGWCSGSKKR